MIRVNLSEARAQLSRMVDAALRGERVVLCRRNVEIAEIRPLRRPLAHRRPIGIDQGLEIPDSFFEPLPEDLLRAFESQGEPDETA